MSLRTFLSRWHWQPDTWRTQRVRAGGGQLRRRSIFIVGALVAFACAVATSGVSTALAAPSMHPGIVAHGTHIATSGVFTSLAASSSQPNFGPSVYIFNLG